MANWELYRNIDGTVIRVFPTEETARRYAEASVIYREPEYSCREQVKKMTDEDKMTSLKKLEREGYCIPRNKEEDSHERMARIKAGLKEIDDSEDIDVTPWEANFLETCLRGYTCGRYLSERQIPVAERMIEKYLG